MLPRTIGVIGGGTAGYLVALAIQRQHPSIDVTVVESPTIPIIGVGEATTTMMPAFLHRVLGLDVVELFRAVRPTFKLGIDFVWGPRDVPSFAYPFGEARPVDAVAWGGDLGGQSVASRLMQAGRGPIVRAPDDSLLSLLPSLKFAYHLDNAPFVAFLARSAAARGVRHVAATIASVTRTEGGIDRLRTTDGRELAFDLYVDATGFRSELVGRALGATFRDYGSSLFCDRAVVGTIRSARDAPVAPYTTAETMAAGWCWRIPLRGEEHVGYVHASSFLDEDAARAELIAKNACLATLDDVRTVRFRSGRHEAFWVGNTVAVGNAYGFVEPLESTALHMVIFEALRIVDGLAAIERGADPASVASTASRVIGEHFDFLRWFLAVHYRWNGRLDTPFWRAARAEVDVSGVEAPLAAFRRGELASEPPEGRPVDPTFGVPGLATGGMVTLLLGQRAPGTGLGKPGMTRDAWLAWDAKNRGLTTRALPHADVLAVLDDQPEMLRAFVEARGSWCARELRGE